MAIFLNFPPISNHLHPLQVENCDSNSRLVVDEDDNGKFRPERVKVTTPGRRDNVGLLLGSVVDGEPSANQHWVKSSNVCMPICW